MEVVWEPKYHFLIHQMDGFLLTFGELTCWVYRGLVAECALLVHSLSFDHLIVLAEQVLDFRHWMARVVLDIVFGILISWVEISNDVFPVQECLSPDDLLMLSEQADELPNRMPFLELLLLLFEIEAPLVVYWAFVEVEEVLAEITFEDALEGLEALLKLTHRLSRYRLHRATMASLAEGGELILLGVIALELLLDDSLFSVGFDSLHVSHVKEWWNGLTFFECLRVHIICHFDLQLALSFNFELRLVLESDKVSLNGIK